MKIEAKIIMVQLQTWVFHDAFVTLRLIQSCWTDVIFVLELLT